MDLKLGRDGSTGKKISGIAYPNNRITKFTINLFNINNCEEWSISARMAIVGTMRLG